MPASPTNRRPLIIGAAAVGVAVVAFLAFGVFGVHTLFIDDEVSEAAPVFTATTVAAEPTNETDTDAEPATDSGDSAPEDQAVAEDAAVDTTAPAEIVPTVAVTGAFVDGDHPTSGTANVLTDGGTQRFLRFEEDFVTDNGPDLNVYLASSADVGDDFVDLGDLTGNIGSQNYELDPEIDLDTYDTVVIWCVRFGVAFGSAPLAAG